MSQHCIQLLAWDENRFDPESADIQFRLGELLLHGETRYSFHPNLKVGEGYTADVYFEAFWGDPRIGVRKVSTERDCSIDEKDGVYRIVGRVLHIDQQSQEMTIDCNGTLVCTMSIVPDVKVMDVLEAEGYFVVYFTDS